MSRLPRGTHTGRILFAGLFALALSGCADERDWGRLHGDVTFSAVEREQIERADRWLAERMRTEPIGIVWDAEHCESPSAGDCEPWSIIRRDGGGGLTDGGRLYVGTLSLQGSPLSNDFLTAIAAHEIGHLRGLHHHPESPGLMNGDELRGLEWTSGDQRSCFADHRCAERP